MRWYGWTAVAVMWMITLALVVATITQLLPPQHTPESSNSNVAEARMP